MDPETPEADADGSRQHGATRDLDLQTHDRRALFEDAPVAMMVEDWSRVKAELDRLRGEGVADFDRYLAAHPEFVKKIKAKHAFIDVNRQTLELFEAPDKATFISQASKLLPADPSSNIRFMRALFCGDRFAQGECILRTRDGELRTVMWRANIPVTDEGLKRVMFYAVDITGHDQAQYAFLNAQAELAHSGRVLIGGELATSIAHEINQPLAAINSFSEAAGRWLSHPEPRIDNALADLSKIGINARRAADIVGHIRSFVRKTPVDKRGHFPGELVDEALALVTWQAHRSRILTRADIEPELAMVTVDSIQIQQVLVNLMINAIQAMSETNSPDHELVVQVKAADSDQVVFEIRDTGPGVPPEDTNRIFEPFVSSRDAGMGMGLAICRTIIRAHGGSLRMENLTPRGALFAFSLSTAA